MSLSTHVLRVLANALSDQGVAQEIVAAIDAATEQTSLKNLAHTIPFTECRVWDALHTMIPGTPASDDLGLVTNTFATSAPTVETGDLKAAGATTRYTRFQFVVPTNYVEGEQIVLRLNAGMKTTVSDTTATILAAVYRTAEPSVNIAAITTAVTINSLTAADVDFGVTNTNVRVGDVLDVRIAIAVNDAATVTAVIGKLNSAAFILASSGGA